MPGQRDTSQETTITVQAQKDEGWSLTATSGGRKLLRTEKSSLLQFYYSISFIKGAGNKLITPWNIIWANRSQALTMFQTLDRPACEWSPCHSEPLQLVACLYLSGLPAHFCSYQKSYDFWESVVLFLSYRLVLPDMLVKIIPINIL